MEKKSTPVKMENIHIKVKETEKKKIVEASDKEGLSLSAFIRFHALRQANQTLGVINGTES